MIRKKKLIITGENLLKVVIRMRRYADGSRTNLEFHGKLSLLF